MNFVHRILMQHEEKGFVDVVAIEQVGMVARHMNRRFDDMVDNHLRNSVMAQFRSIERGDGSFGRSADFGRA